MACKAMFRYIYDWKVLVPSLHKMITKCLCGWTVRKVLQANGTVASAVRPLGGPWPAGFGGVECTFAYLIEQSD